MKDTNLPTFLKFGNAKKSDICVFFAKKSSLATKLEGDWSKTGGLCPRPGFKAVTAEMYSALWEKSEKLLLLHTCVYSLNYSQKHIRCKHLHSRLSK